MEIFSGRMEPAALQQVVVDAQTTTGEKPAALGRLRRENARTPEVVATMVGVYQNSTDARTRAEIFNQLDGVTDPVLKNPLLQGLAIEENARVREEAADVLGGYHNDPDVAAWLQHIAQNDPDPRVQRQALASLQGFEELREGRPGPGEGRSDRGGRGAGGR